MGNGAPRGREVHAWPPVRITEIEPFGGLFVPLRKICTREMMSGVRIHVPGISTFPTCCCVCPPHEPGARILRTDRRMR